MNNSIDFRIRTGHIVNDTNSINSKNSKLENRNEFKNILDNNIKKNENSDLISKEFKISAHAQRRMDERNIYLPKEDIKLIEDAFKKLENKGARESLILYKDMGFISSIKNKTIITAIDTKDLDVVTNIDSMVLIK